MPETTAGPQTYANRANHSKPTFLSLKLVGGPDFYLDMRTPSPLSLSFDFPITCPPTPYGYPDTPHTPFSCTTDTFPHDSQDITIPADSPFYYPPTPPHSSTFPSSAAPTRGAFPFSCEALSDELSSELAAEAFHHEITRKELPIIVISARDPEDDAGGKFFFRAQMQMCQFPTNLQVIPDFPVDFEGVDTEQAQDT